MGTLPQKIKWRTPQNARLGIKSSLSNIRRVVSLAYVLYVCNDKKARLNYSEEYRDGSATKIKLSPYFQERVESYFAGKDINEQIAANPLLSSQLEALQVGLELVLQIGKISFVGNMASSAERTGGNRFAKTISFSTNIIQIDLLLSAYSEEDRTAFLFSWLSNEKSTTPIENALTSLLAIFTENVKMSISDGNSDVIFEQEGIYKQLIEGQDVLAKDAHEDVGPLRIYKSFVREGLHPYISFAGNDFVPRLDTEDIKNYLSLVSTALDLKNSDMPAIGAFDGTADVGLCGSESAAQKIFYGCPGTGKSYKVKDIAEGIKDAAHPEDGWKTIWYQPATKEDKTCSKVENPSDDDKKKLTTNIFRTTFHPDYDYATFVGCYKPVKEGGSLDYKFVPQVFTNAYVCALRHPEDPIYLIIEEINRGNCAQIFGDLFQLLDRTNGESDYSIEPDTELAKYLKSEEVDSERLSLPSNLHIYATMNTSDQSLFPMDSAFKRRWEMEYIPINYEQEKASKFLIKIGSALYSWTRFITVVNELIIDATGSEDKQLGEFFVKARDAKEGENKEYKYIDTDLFINKVMFFIWNDVCKDYYNPRHTGSQFFMRIAGAEGAEKDIFTFADLYSPRNVGNTLILRFMSYLENTYMKTHKDLKAEYIDKGKPWLMTDPIKVETTAALAE